MNLGLPVAQMLAISLGASMGALLRWAAGLWLNASWAGFPLGTLLVNGMGGLLIGISIAWFQQVTDELLSLLLVTGFLGGLTTFSSFSGESLLLLQRGEWLLALGHTAAHLLGSLGCAALGFGLMRAVFG